MYTFELPEYIVKLYKEKNWPSGVLMKKFKFL